VGQHLTNRTIAGIAVVSTKNICSLGDYFCPFNFKISTIFDLKKFLQKNISLKLLIAFKLCVFFFIEDVSVQILNHLLFMLLEVLGLDKFLCTANAIDEPVPLNQTSLMGKIPASI